MKGINHKPVLLATSYKLGSAFPSWNNSLSHWKNKNRFSWKKANSGLFGRSGGEVSRWYSPHCRARTHFALCHMSWRSYECDLAHKHGINSIHNVMNSTAAIDNCHLEVMVMLIDELKRDPTEVKKRAYFIELVVVVIWECHHNLQLKLKLHMALQSSTSPHNACGNGPLINICTNES